MHFFLNQCDLLLLKVSISILTFKIKLQLKLTELCLEFLLESQIISSIEVHTVELSYNLMFEYL